MKKVFVYGICAFAISAAPALAQQTSGTSSRQGTTSTQSGSRATTQSGSAASAATQSKQAANADHEFVTEAAMGGMAEVELGQMATDKAQSEQVKQFAQRMVTDHGKANDELKSLAQSKSISLPTDIGAKHKATKDRLSKLSGAAFDRAYMQEMVTDHRKDVSEFQKESKSGKDPEVKAWASKTLPTLEEHLRLAESANRSAVGTSGTKSGSDTEKTLGGSRGTTGSSTPTTPRTGGTPDSNGGSSTPRSGSSGGTGSATGSGSSSTPR